MILPPPASPWGAPCATGALPHLFLAPAGPAHRRPSYAAVVPSCFRTWEQPTDRLVTLFNLRRLRVTQVPHSDAR